ncbi:hypothetical protein JHK87_018914 [Glycine soja]|nr:hypothetical protein JHK87_018914 [Glycine soja]
MTVIALIKALARERMNDELSQVLLNILRSCKLNDAKVAKVLLEVNFKEGNMDSFLSVLTKMVKDGLLPDGGIHSSAPTRGMARHSQKEIGVRVMLCTCSLVEGCTQGSASCAQLAKPVKRKSIKDISKVQQQWPTTLSKCAQRNFLSVGIALSERPKPLVCLLKRPALLSLDFQDRSIRNYSCYIFGEDAVNNE